MIEKAVESPTDDLKKRVQQFNCLELPGQPMGMHMGTSYLVNDLMREIERLRSSIREGGLEVGGAREDARTAGALTAEKAAIRGFYVASRASLPERPAMWRRLRAEGMPINSTWIDEAGDGETHDLGELWARIHQEIATSEGVILYAKQEDFPLKGALIECGIALGMGRPVAILLDCVDLEPRSLRPLGSWARHDACKFVDHWLGAVEFIRSYRQDAAVAGAEQGTRNRVGPPSLEDVRGLVIEECAKVADEAAQHERDNIAEARETLGKDYDHNSFGSGWEVGALTTAENIAEAIRALNPTGGKGEA